MHIFDLTPELGTSFATQSVSFCVSCAGESALRFPGHVRGLHPAACLRLPSDSHRLCRRCASLCRGSFPYCPLRRCHCRSLRHRSSSYYYALRCPRYHPLRRCSSSNHRLLRPHCDSIRHRRSDHSPCHSLCRGSSSPTSASRGRHLPIGREASARQRRGRATGMQHRPLYCCLSQSALISASLTCTAARDREREEDGP